MSAQNSHGNNSKNVFRRISGNIGTGGVCDDSLFSPGILDDKQMLLDSKTLNFQTSVDSTHELFSDDEKNTKFYLNNNHYNNNVPGFGLASDDEFQNSDDNHSSSNKFISDEKFDKSALESAGLLDLDGLSLDEDSDWLTKQKNGMVTHSNTLNWLMKDDLDSKPLHSVKDNKFASLNRSSTTLYKSATPKRNDGAKLDSSTDYGTVTQIIGVPPLSTSNKDLSTVGRDLSVAKLQNSGMQQRAVDMALPHTTNAEFTKMNSTNSTSNGNLLYGSGYILADVNDVQNVAKLQEQSLRMSFSTPLVNSGMEMALNKSSGNVNNEVINSGNQGGRQMTVAKLKQPSKLASTSSGHLSTNARKEAFTVSRPSQQQSSTNKSMLKKSTGFNKPDMSDYQSVPNVSHNINQHTTRRLAANPSNGDSHQQSLPNINRNQSMSLAKSNQGSRATSENYLAANCYFSYDETSPKTNEYQNSGRPSLAAARQPTSQARSAAPTRQLPNPSQGKATSVIGVTGGRISNIGLNNSRLPASRPTTNSSGINKPITLSGITSKTSTFSATAGRQISNSNISRSAPKNSSLATNTSRLNSTLKSSTMRTNTSTTIPPRGSKVVAPSSIRSTNQQPPVNKMIKTVSNLRSNTPMSPLLKKSNLPMNGASPMKPSPVATVNSNARLGGRPIRKFVFSSS
ncbi:hypothetical protein HELRODRAFT_168017 [Helobdella robusta]|uniref:Uncharacterized protein n=1 Tax=Helobdella robusta TaxID=6412 RepID=T1F026_HELRO|nr:hypothetical protein HELRODRAFT_168017 [Helobdella robusta]ESO10152.1 hypothetical protein HELRODRAFT_168017 [Helobdella robusta]